MEDESKPVPKGKKIDKDGFEIIEKKHFVKKHGRGGRRPYRKDDAPRDKPLKDKANEQ